jgi:cytochrome c peroxidase
MSSLREAAGAVRGAGQSIKQIVVPTMLFLVAGAAAASGFSLLGKNSRPTRVVSARTVVEPDVLADEPIHSIPRHIELDEKKVALGRRLFHDPRLSDDNSISCASCHNLRAGGTDQRVTSVGIGGAFGNINAPTVFNSGFNFRQFWDGRAATLEDQIDAPVHDPTEMRSNWPAVLKKLHTDPGYRTAFSSLYPQGVNSDAVKDAIATFERSLITPESRFDRFLRGDAAALSTEEKQGYRLFKENGCSSCHQGVLAGGNMFEKLGIVADYFADRGHITKADLGRFNVTGQESDRYEFKVPGLRNVARTAPYFHDGSAKTLQEAVRVMAKYQVGRELAAPDVERIVLFLKTLDGDTGESE